ncbi:MAG: CPBP family intramembrane metalloprotease [Myxococcales bacterium]|nr:CPBP family intramembrane metalloprotease [Myxococcales bacterium]MCB9532720.1 CPBP family intramembrane metalloprotease [Myxococcales bacterium]
MSPDAEPRSTGAPFPERLNAWLGLPAGSPTLDARATIVFVAAAVLLTLFHYYGKADAYRRYFAESLDPLWPERWSEFAGLTSYAWWAASSIVLRTLVPALLIVFVFRERLSDWGYRFRGQLAHIPKYLALYAVMAPLLALAATQASFQARYPFYERAREGGAQFWAFELLYGPQFLGVEAFFRGFLIFGLAPRLGVYSLLVSAVPYVMIHFNKPLPETLGALVAGVVLGAIALRSRSFVLGVALHWWIATSMDFLAVAQHVGGFGEAVRLVFGLD